MDLVLWRPLSILNPRLGQDQSSSGPLSPSSSGGSELAPIMEVEVERERAEASSMMQQQPHPYEGIPQAAGDIMQEEALPDFDEDMDLWKILVNNEFTPPVQFAKKMSDIISSFRPYIYFHWKQ